MAALVLLLGRAAVALEVPPLTGRVSDLAGLLAPAERARLDEKLSAYERATGHQFAVLLVPSLEGEPLEDYTMRVVEAWKLGRAHGDDGLLLFVALAERRFRIEVGYGLEGVVTDALAAQVERNVLAPAFREKRYGEGVEAALDLLMRAAGGEAVAPQAGGGEHGGRGSLILWLVMMGLFMLLVRRPRGLGWFVLGSMLGSSRGWSSGGRRGGGGGFGGGGGRFGGGGASGGW